jgi:hypothetical protein
MKKLFLGLLLILLVSGCVTLPFDIPFLSGQGGTNVTELGPDVIVIQNINVIPGTSVRPEDSFSVYFELKNQEENRMVPSSEDTEDVKYNLFDTGLCTWTGGTSYPQTTGSIDPFSPLETKLIEWNFKAPSAEQIAFLSINCPIRFKISYPFTAVSQIDVGIIDEDRLRDLQRAGEDVTYVPSLSVGRGPIKIYFDFGNTLPVRNNTNLSVYIKVNDKGNGLLGEISNESDKQLIIEVSDKFQSLDCLKDYFKCEHVDNIWRCHNEYKPIPLIKKETFEIRCVLETPLTVNVQETFYITAKLNYIYDVLGEANIEVKP